MTNYTDFASSLEVVIDEKYQHPGDLPMITTPVCSLSARFLSGTVSAADVVFTSDTADYHEYQALADGTHEPAVQLIYQKHWLDSLDLISKGDLRELLHTASLISVECTILISCSQKKSVADNGNLHDSESVNCLKASEGFVSATFLFTSGVVREHRFETIRVLRNLHHVGV